MSPMQVSGTTATVAAISGWEAVIANVGDSCAYLDTGVEVVLVSTPLSASATTTCGGIDTRLLASLDVIEHIERLYQHFVV